MVVGNTRKKGHLPLLVVLAGGLGSRFGGNKQIAEIPGLGRSIMELSIIDAHNAGISEIVLVINAAIKPIVQAHIVPRLPQSLTIHLVEQCITDVPTQYLELVDKRKKPWGTGHALLAARAYITKPAIVITADDYYGPQAYHQLVAHFASTCGDEQHMAMVGYPIGLTLSNQGGVNRGLCKLDRGSLSSVVECLNISKQGSKLIGECAGQVTEISKSTLASMTFWGITPILMMHLADGFSRFLDIHDNVVKKEYYLPDCIQACISSNQAHVTVYSAMDHWYGITFKEELDTVAGKLNELRQG
ncbi:NTP transferase domain-containing protein [Pseudoalteromonas sp. MMG013]|uniref:NTP transferase domain-containing protein n=1 Tax=unclassified Pseudoalteromonas TaxID=194690 RepID=UPI001B359F67|nr:MULTISPECIES: NTP transferase domain-containing protein [unclassified Pseudoalteromonas]MBQ4844149.1 NTP transferase domain-containing protein [Pseudoalteromonas sp. MMG005]MBQ4861230.1 NTP transferase domain-containing protein [Pseudoalteromonas sp. MMG013]